MTFFQKKVKQTVFYVLVSDPIVMRMCLSVRDDFFAFPIDFFWGLPPSLYAAEVLCAAFFLLYPPKLNREIENAQMTKPYCNRETVNNYASNSSKSVSRAGESFIFMFCDDACKQNCEKTYANKYSLLCLPALGFLGPNWGSKMTPPRALWTPRWRHGEPRWH